MGAISTKGTRFCITAGDAVATELTPTDITKAAPAVVTVADVTGLVAGQIIFVPADATGLESIDGKYFIVGDVDDTGNTFALLGSDTTDDVGTFAAADSLEYYTDDNMVCLCLSNFQFNPETPDTIAVPTYCDPSATLPATTTSAGTATIGGYANKADADYLELLDADEDGVARVWRIMLPDNGYIIFPGVITGLTWQVPIEGAVAYEATVVLTTKPRHVF